MHRRWGRGLRRHIGLYVNEFSATWGGGATGGHDASETAEQADHPASEMDIFGV